MKFEWIGQRLRIALEFFEAEVKFAKYRASRCHTRSELRRRLWRKVLGGLKQDRSLTAEKLRSV